MTPAEYSQQALRTEAPVGPVLERINNLPSLLWYLVRASELAKGTGLVHSGLKRKMFYGKPTEGWTFNNVSPTWSQANQPMRQAWEVLQSNPQVLRLVHSLLGQMDEVCEKWEMLSQILFQGQPIDTKHWVEEDGDLEWYQNIERDALGVSREEVWDVNLTKLLGIRYKSGQFTEQEAAERDLAAEQAAMSERLAQFQAGAQAEAAEAEKFVGTVTLISATDPNPFRQEKTEPEPAPATESDISQTTAEDNVSGACILTPENIGTEDDCTTHEHEPSLFTIPAPAATPATEPAAPPA